ncbi:MAG: IclR family transcriptional regulator [Rhizobiaceae bacterium]|nr:IclR family transcriptional regulator [Rhizobiaceae bacterium]
MARTTRAESGDEGEQALVGALVRGMAILRAFRPNDPSLGNQELSDRTGVPKPTVSRLCRTLTALGYLNHDAATERYELGGGVLTLGHVAMANLDVVRVADPFIREFAHANGTTSGLGTRQEGRMAFLSVSMGSASLAMRARPGTRVPIASTAMGRAYLWLLGEDERRDFMRDLQRSDPEDWLANRGRIEEAFRQIDSHGFCATVGEWQNDINAVAVPLSAPQVIGRYVLVCAGPATRTPVDKLTFKLGPELLALAEKISLALGVAPMRRG